MGPNIRKTIDDEKDNRNNSNAQHTPALLIASSGSIGSIDPDAGDFLTKPLREIICDYLDLDNEELLKLVYQNNAFPKWLVYFANANLPRVISQLMTANPSFINNLPDSSIDNVNLNAAYTNARFPTTPAKIIVADEEKESTEEKDEKEEQSQQQRIIVGLNEDISGGNFNSVTRLLMANHETLTQPDLAVIRKRLNAQLEKMKKLTTLSQTIAEYAAQRSCQPFATPNHHFGYLQKIIGVLCFIIGAILVGSSYDDHQYSRGDENAILRHHIGIGLMCAIVLLINCLKLPIHTMLRSLPTEIQKEVKKTLTDVYIDTTIAKVQHDLQQKITQQLAQKSALERALAACPTEEKRPNDDIVITVSDPIIPVGSINGANNLFTDNDPKYDSKQDTNATTPLLYGKTSYPPNFLSGNGSNRNNNSSSVTPVRNLDRDYHSMGNSEEKTCSLRPTSS